MGLLDFNNPEVMQALQLMATQKGGLLNTLGQIGQQNDQRQERALREEMQRQLMEQRRMEMEQQRRAMGIQQQKDALAQRAFAPNQNLVQNDDEGNAMPSSGGGGFAEYGQGMMQIDPNEALSLQAHLSQLNAPKYQKIGEGESLYDMRDPSKPLVQGAPKLPTGMVMGQKGPEYMPGYLAGQEQIRRAGKTDVTTNVMPPREIFKDSMTLKKDFDAQPEVKGFKEVQSAWDQIRTALQDPSAANDLAAATKFMKLLDPGSVVRESELHMAMQASGALDRFMNYANRLKTGQKLTPTQRQDFYSSGEALYNASRQRFGQTAGQYEGIAKQYGLDSQFLPKKPEQPKANLQRNSTAIYKAREAIKRGANPEAVRQRLREQGYDDGGL